MLTHREKFLIVLTMCLTFTFCTPRAHVPNDGYSYNFFNFKTFMIKMDEWLENTARQVSEHSNGTLDYETTLRTFHFVNKLLEPFGTNIHNVLKSFDEFLKDMKPEYIHNVITL